MKCSSHDLAPSPQPGRLKEVQALGWYLEEANLAQVSINIMDFEVTAIHTVYEEVCKDAEVRCVCQSLRCLVRCAWNSYIPSEK